MWSSVLQPQYSSEEKSIKGRNNSAPRPISRGGLFDDLSAAILTVLLVQAEVIEGAERASGLREPQEHQVATVTRTVRAVGRKTQTLLLFRPTTQHYHRRASRFARLGDTVDVVVHVIMQMMMMMVVV